MIPQHVLFTVPATTGVSVHGDDARSGDAKSKTAQGDLGGDEEDDVALDLNDKKSIRAQWARHEKQKREHAVLLQQGNTRFKAKDIEMGNHMYYNLYNTDKHLFKLDKNVSGMQRFLNY